MDQSDPRIAEEVPSQSKNQKSNQNPKFKTNQNSTIIAAVTCSVLLNQSLTVHRGRNQPRYLFSYHYHHPHSTTLEEEALAKVYVDVKVCVVYIVITIICHFVYLFLLFSRVYLFIISEFWNL